MSLTSISNSNNYVSSDNSIELYKNKFQAVSKTIENDEIPIEQRMKTISKILFQGFDIMSEEHKDRVKFQKECTVYKAKVDEQAIENAELKAKVAHHTIENAGLKAKIAHHTIENAEIKEKLAETTEIVVDLTNEKDEVNKRLDKLKKENIESKKSSIKKKSEKQIKSLQSQLNAAQSGRIALLVFSAITTPVLIGAAGIIGSELGIVPEIDSLKERLWVLEHYPEAVKDEELNKKASIAINSYNEEMKSADRKEDAWFDFNSEGPSTFHYELKNEYSEKAAKMRQIAETKLEATKKELNAHVKNKFYS
jgi:hypothetical protein